MSHFYAMIDQSARQTRPTACGHKNTGIGTITRSWHNEVRTTINADDDGNDVIHVTLNGRTLYRGTAVLGTGPIDPEGGQ